MTTWQKKSVNILTGSILGTGIFITFSPVVVAIPRSSSAGGAFYAQDNLNPGGLVSHGYIEAGNS